MGKLTDSLQAGINQTIIKHTKSACLPIIESKSILDHNRKLLQALDEDLKWVLSKNVNCQRFQRSLMLIVPLIISDVLL